MTPRADASEMVRMKAPLIATLRADARQMVRVRAALMASKKDRQTGVDLGSVMDPKSDTVVENKRRYKSDEQAPA